ncbi:unnamed protein product [Calypogeia fissa]
MVAKQRQSSTRRLRPPKDRAEVAVSKLQACNSTSNQALQAFRDWRRQEGKGNISLLILRRIDLIGVIVVVIKRRRDF